MDGDGCKAGQTFIACLMDACKELEVHIDHLFALFSLVFLVLGDFG